MILQIFLQVNKIACTIYRKISLNIAVGYCRIECTASTMMLKPIYSMASIIFTSDIGFIYYSKMFNAIVFCCNNRNALFQYRPTLASSAAGKYGRQEWPTSVASKSGQKVWLARVAGKCGWQVWPTSVASKCGWQVWLALVACKCGWHTLKSQCLYVHVITIHMK